VSRIHEPRLSLIFQRILLTSLGIPPLVVVACSDDQPVEKIESVVATGGTGPKPEASPCDPTVADVYITSIEGSAVCYAYHVHECGAPEGILQADANCSFTFNDCQKLCSLSGAYVCNAIDNSCDDAGMVRYEAPFQVACEFCPSTIGRRPEGLHLATGARGRNALGDHFARMSELEAASVTAFERLTQELELHAAPRSLVQAAKRARRDEIRHARVTRQLARRFGAEPASVRVAPEAPRTLEVIAIENAVEGCVRETFGALMAHFQAARAGDPAIRETLKRLAGDETRHAALGWEVASWVEERLDVDANARVRAARNEAVATLSTEIAEPAPELVDQAGIPTATEQERLLSELASELYV
jgi:hypothetical protein